MKKEASPARAPVVQPIDPFLPETGWPRQIDPAYGLEPAQAADQRPIRCRSIVEKGRADSLAQFTIGDSSANGVLESAFECFMKQGWLRLDRSAQAYPKNFFQEQATD